MAANAPRNMNSLATMEVKVRSDYATWCQGVDNLCEQLSLIIHAMADDLYVRLVAGSRDHNVRVRARRATRPLLHLATAIRACGRLAPRAYRIYARQFADEINPQRAQRKFDHQK
jgi:hypothetical protein